MDNNELMDTILSLETAALERWNSGDPSGYLELYDDQITYFDPFFDHKLCGIERMREYYEGMRGTVNADGYTIIDPAVQALGADGAVLTYNLDSVSGTERFLWNCTEVYRRGISGKWKIIHTHWAFTKEE